MIGDFVGGVRCTRDDNHHEEVDPAPFVVEGLKIRKGRDPREDGHDDELGPEGVRAQIPGVRRRSITSQIHILLVGWEGIGEGEFANGGNQCGIGFVGDERAGESDCPC